MLIDYDRTSAWAPVLSEVLGSVAPGVIEEEVAAAKLEWIEDALELVFELADREAIIEATVDWVGRNSVAAYHGSRLTESELAEVLEEGLTPLRAHDRRTRLERALSSHSGWPEAKQRLEKEIEAHGPGQAMGKREKQVHLTLSESGLTRGFSHYLERGSEFDQRVAHALLGEDGPRLLEQDGEAVVFRLSVPGEAALKAAHRHFTVADLRRMGEVPNIVRELLSAWAFRINDPGFEASTMRTDCGLVFGERVPPDWILRFSPWAAATKEGVLRHST